MAIPGVSFLYLTDIFDVQPVWRAFSQLSWAPMINDQPCTPAPHSLIKFLSDLAIISQMQGTAPGLN